MPLKTSSQIPFFDGVRRFESENEADFSIDWANFAEPFRSLEQIITDAGQLDGVIALIFSGTVEAFEKLAIPVVNVGHPAEGTGLPSVTCDLAEVGRVAARNFLARGFQRFAFVGFHDESLSEEMETGYRETVGPGYAVERLLIENGDHGPGLEDRLSQWISELPKATAIFAVNDGVALFTVKTACQLGLRVPIDLAVVGTDDNTWFSSLSPVEISSIPRQRYEVGYRAAEKIHRILTGEEVEISESIRPGDLIERDSTHIFAGAPPLLNQLVSHIQKRACEGLNVQDLMDRFRVSRRTINYLFEKHVGRSPYSEIQRIRLIEVRHLLSTTGYSVETIAQLTGFEDGNHLSRFFRKKTGVTCTQFRRTHPDLYGMD